MVWNCIESGLVDRKPVLALAADLYTGSMATRKLRALELLGRDSLASSQVKKVSKCNRRWRCNSPFCPHCSIAENSSHLRRVPPGTVLDPTVVNYVGPEHGMPLSRNYRVRAGQAMTRPFDGLPSHEVGAATVMLGVLRGGDAYRERFVTFKDDIRRSLSFMNGDARAYFRIEFVLKYAGDIRQSFDDVAPGRLCLGDIPDDEIVVLAHAHGLTHIPGMPRSYVGDRLRETFTGQNQVNVRAIKFEVVTPDGMVTSGAQGFAEYAGKKKTSKLLRQDLSRPQIELDEERAINCGNRLGGGDKSDAIDLVAIKKLNQRDAAIAVFAEAEMFRILFGMNMTVRVGVNKKRQIIQCKDHIIIDVEDDLAGYDIKLIEPVVKVFSIDTTNLSACDHQTRPNVILLPITVDLQVRYESVDVPLQLSVSNITDSFEHSLVCIHIYNWSQGHYVAYPYFIEPKWVSFQKRVSFGRDVRPP